MMKLFNKCINNTIKILVPLIVLTLMVGIAKIFIDVFMSFKSTDINKGFDMMITNILSMFVVIELFKSIIEYFEIQRLKITFIIDAAIVFLLREVMIGLYLHKMKVDEIKAIAILLFVIGVIRTLAILISPGNSLEESKSES